MVNLFKLELALSVVLALNLAQSRNSSCCVAASLLFEHGTRAASPPVQQPAKADDGRPERGKLLPDPASSKDLYEAYSEIQKDYESKAFCANQHHWKILNDKHNVRVSLLTHPHDPSCPYVKMEGRIPVPVEDCWEWLRVDDWDRTMKVMDPYYEGSEIHGDYSYELPANKRINNQKNVVRMLLCRKRTKRILAFGKRDLVFLSVAEEQPTADGSWVSGTVSVRTEQLPRRVGYTRAFQDSIAFYKPVENNTQTYVDVVLCECIFGFDSRGSEVFNSAVSLISIPQRPHYCLSY